SCGSCRLPAAAAPAASAAPAAGSRRAADPCDARGGGTASTRPASRRSRRTRGPRRSSCVLLGRVRGGRGIDPLSGARTGGPLGVQRLPEDHPGGDLIHDLAVLPALAARAV